MRIPQHIGIIPDGNRRWAKSQGMDASQGYAHGISPGMAMYYKCRELGVKELTVYGFTVDNTKRPSSQRKAFTEACIGAVKELSREDAELLVLGNTDSAMFPEELLPYTRRHTFGKGGMKVNFLVNYSWEWDLGLTGGKLGKTEKKDCLIGPMLRSGDVSRVDLIIRWGGRSRLSGFLPVQSVYADICVLEEYWPEFTPEHIEKALRWYAGQDVTLGG